MLLLINEKNKMSMRDLWRLVYKFTFDKKNCPHNTIKILNENINKWNYAFEMDMARYHEAFGCYPEMGSILHETSVQMKYLATWMVEEEKGLKETLASTYKKHGIDYRLVAPMSAHFPEYASNRNFKRGQAHLKQAMKDNPQDYAAPKTFKPTIVTES